MTADTPVFASEIPHQTAIPFFQKWRSFGTGLGVEIGPEHLQVTLTVVRPAGIRILDTLEILRYRERPSAEWGADFQSFLSKHKMDELLSIQNLPRNSILEGSLELDAAQKPIAGWRAQILPFGPVGQSTGDRLERVRLETWLQSGSRRRTLQLESFRTTVQR